MDFAINCKERIIDYYNKTKMDKDKNNNFEICARAIIQNNGKILVCYEKGNDYYFTPGGHINFGESAKEALYRELKEELNISIKRCSFIGAVENIFVQNDENHHELDLVFNIEAGNVSDKSEEDHIDFLFMDIERFSKEEILPIVLQKALLKWLKDKKMFWVSQIYDKSIL